MDEFAVANVDAHMAESAAHGVEEDQVAWVEFTAVNFFCGFGLLVGTPWQQSTHRGLINMPNKTAAIRAKIAPRVGCF